MRFIHIADMHFDTPFTFLGEKENLGDIRRIEQRQAFQRMINYIKEQGIPYLFISGDLYDHNYIKKTTIEYINNLFDKMSIEVRKCVNGTFLVALMVLFCDSIGFTLIGLKAP